jgi:hypothetical protein
VTQRFSSFEYEICALALYAPFRESWPQINLTHLWFLYYLACVTALFLVARKLFAVVAGPEGAIRDSCTSYFVAYQKVG